MPTIEDFVQASVGALYQYDIIEYHGVKLLIPKNRIKELVRVSWERTYNPEIQKLADEMGIELRKLRR